MNATPILLSLLALTLSVSAQKKTFIPVNRDQVEKAVSDIKVPTYYPVLLDRFNNFDTTLTKDEYRLLYYGFVFQKSYAAYPEMKTKEIRTAMKDKDYRKASLICDSVLMKYPVSLDLNFSKFIALYSENPNSREAARYRARYTNLMLTIIASGDGKTCKTGFKTIFISDEYEIIFKYMQIEGFLGQTLDGNCDILKVKPSAEGADNQIYFDTSETLRKEAELFK